MLWRHGDVLIAAVSALPSHARRRPGSVLAHGEVTGHSHRFADLKDIQLWEVGNELFVEVLSDQANLVHEEHKTLSIPKGTYRVWMQREYSPEAIRPVVD